MNEQLRKAIDDLGMFERMKGVDHPQTILLRQTLERLYKALADPPRDPEPDESSPQLADFLKRRKESPDWGSQKDLDDAAETANSERDYHQNQAREFGRRADQVRKQGEPPRPADFNEDYDFTPDHAEYHDRFADAHQQTANDYQKASTAYKQGNWKAGEEHFGRAQDQGYRIDDLKGQGRYPGYRAFGSDIWRKLGKLG